MGGISYKMDPTVRYRHRYHRLDEPLQAVMKSLSLDEDKVKNMNHNLHKLLDDHLIPQMRARDPLFEQLFGQLHYMGSFYEGLRIKEPNEFDLNVELRLPNACRAGVTCENCPPGFLKIKCDSREHVAKWISDDGFLLREKVLYWMKSVVDKALQYIHISNVQIRRSTSGPAVTLNITALGDSYSVDLVPVFQFKLDQWPGPPVRQPQSTETFSLVWNAVPKGPLAFGFGDTSKYWRMSFYNQEKRIMNNLAVMKPSIKLMKLLRDEEGWHQLSSYYIKTVALWVNDANKNLWKCSLGVVFMEILSAFKTWMDRKSIPFYWDQRHNLLSGLDQMEIDKIGNRIARIIKKIDQILQTNPEELNAFLYQLFGNNKKNQRSASQNFGSIDSFNNEPVSPTSTDVSTTALTVGFGALALGAVAVGAFLALAPSRNRRD